MIKLCELHASLLKVHFSAFGVFGKKFGTLKVGTLSISHILSRVEIKWVKWQIHSSDSFCLQVFKHHIRSISPSNVIHEQKLWTSRIPKQPNWDFNPFFTHLAVVTEIPRKIYSLEWPFVVFFLETIKLRARESKLCVPSLFYIKTLFSNISTRQLTILRAQFSWLLWTWRRHKIKQTSLWKLKIIGQKPLVFSHTAHAS